MLNLTTLQVCNMMANIKLLLIWLSFMIASAIDDSDMQVTPSQSRNSVPNERDLLLEAYKRQILHRLGMERPPPAPEFSITEELTKKIIEYDPTEALVNEEDIKLNPFIAKVLEDDSENRSEAKPNERYRIVFSLPPYHKKRMRKVKIESATLYLYVVGRNDSDCVLYEESQSNKSDENDTKESTGHELIDFYIQLSDFDERTSERERNHVKIDSNGRIMITIYELNATNHQIGTPTYHRGNNGWWTFNFTNIVKRWQTSGTGRIRLHIDIELFDSEPNNDFMNMRIITQPCNETDLYRPSYRMFSSDVADTVPRLDIRYLHTSTRRRNKRQTSPSLSCDDLSSPLPCCMKSTVFTFKELGLSDIIISPLLFTASYCTGTCSTFLTQSRLETGNRKGQCCGPSKTEDLHVLVLDRNEFKRVNISNLLVINCGCN
ncbi:uncharacterized protein [Antedon mediterranea]|uniref:uncharacterized protein n=1 Tax=Antedon mediterranea TaxID=105859 RepID=UPI003AF7F70C